MPGSDAAYDATYGVEDLYPETEEDHARLLSWATQAFQAADEDRAPHYERWKRYYKLYRSYVKRKPGDWTSKVFYPVSFWVVETITPRLIASLPKMIVLPMSEDDEEPAKRLEQLLDWSASHSGLYIELTSAIKSALIYGTGILKNFYDQRFAVGRQARLEPIFQSLEVPVLDPESGEPMFGPDDNPVTDVQQAVVGEQQVIDRVSFPVYEGPASEDVDIFNFWVAPEAEDIQNARYTIERKYRDRSFIERRIAEGVYRWPDHLGPDDVQQILDEPIRDRAGEIELGAATDSTREAVEILEFWTIDGRVLTVANRRAILRHTTNPFDHGQKPYIRLVDHLVPHEFWGIGEIEPMEGMQDVVNMLTNLRIDNLRLLLNPIFGVALPEIEDLRDLRLKPGGIIRTKGGMPVRDVLDRVDLGDVTASAFVEVDHTLAMIERATGVSAYQLGVAAENLNRTATGVSLITESGDARFQLKTRLMEMTGLKDLAYQYGSILQQFTTQERVIRLLGPEGQFQFERFTPEGIIGRMDYDIEAASSVQTESKRRDDALTLLQVAAPLFPQAAQPLFEDLLRVWGVRNPHRYLGTQQQQAPGIGPLGAPNGGAESPVSPEELLGQGGAPGGVPLEVNGG